MPIFQSTLPAGGATQISIFYLHDFFISIHAPRGGSDYSGWKYNRRACGISIHAPRGGSDAVLTLGLGCVSRFQSTLPAGGATCQSLPAVCKALYFNPRSPRGERLPIPHTLLTSSDYFNPRSPRGERPVKHRNNTNSGLDFNPRSPRGERRCNVSGCTTPEAYFNPRSPRGERRVTSPDARLQRPISIHAPRGGSDSKSACFLCENLSIYHKFCTQIFLKAFSPLLST